MKYPELPGFKKTDTSRKAAHEVKTKAKTLREQVLNALFRFGPNTADDIAYFMSEDILSIRPRFSELALKGEIIDTGMRGINKSGKSAIIWSLK